MSGGGGWLRYARLTHLDFGARSQFGVSESPDRDAGVRQLTHI